MDSDGKTLAMSTSAVVIWLILWFARAQLEGEMVLHMTVQLPSLIVIGYMIAKGIAALEPRWFAKADWLGIPGLLSIIFTSSFWMLPRMFDLARSSSCIDLVKFVTLPLFVGLPLGLSWPRIPALGRSFLWANFIPKLGAIGGLYLEAPTQLCASYRLDQQTLTGAALIGVAILLGLLWLAAAIIGLSSFSRRSGHAAGRSGQRLRSWFDQNNDAAEAR